MKADCDYLIVGSGAGGGPLAAKLAIAGFKVIVLEAGGDPCCETEMGKWMYEVPIFHGLSTEYPECRWDYFVRHYAEGSRQAEDTKFVKTDPVSGEPVNGVWYPRAGTLGGCTAHNAMITVTPQEKDWNDIAAVTGDRSWCAENMNKYFSRLENCHYRPRPWSLTYVLSGLIWSIYAIFRRDKWRDWAHGHGFTGWLQTSEADPRLIIKDLALLKVIYNTVRFDLRKRLGNPLLSLFTKLDPNDLRNGRDLKEGLAFTPLAVADGKRNGPRDLLIKTQELYPERLQVRLHSLAKRVVFEGATAIGVELFRGAHLYKSDPAARSASVAHAEPGTETLYASREVILCAGAFNTPQLLKLSGIGPKEELERLGIDVLVDLPGVGENLQDRYEVGVISEFDRSFALLKGATFEPPNPEYPEDPYFIEWEGGKGLYTSNGSLIGILKRSTNAEPEPDLYIFGLPGYFKGYFPQYSSQFERNKNRFTWAILKAYTRNRTGTVRLRSADPRDWPDILFNSFPDGTTPETEDLNAVVSGIDFVRAMNKALGSCKEIWPGDHVKGSALREFVANEAWGHHASCSCKIGAEGDPMAVLDSRFKVRGVRSLRVVDASVFPKIPGYFIVSAIYMISEKAVDVILADA